MVKTAGEIAADARRIALELRQEAAKLDALADSIDPPPKRRPGTRPAPSKAARERQAQAIKKAGPVLAR